MTLLHGLALVLVVSTAQAAAPDNAQQAQMERELQGLIERWVARGLLPDEGVVRLQNSELPTVALGLLVDSELAADGLQVLAVTPGGLADELGLRPGDLVQRFNDLDLTVLGSSGAASLREAMGALRPGDELHFTIARSRIAVDLSGTVPAPDLPAYTLEMRTGGRPVEVDERGCGEVSILVDPPATQRLSPVRVTRINEASTGVLSRDRFVLRPGLYRLRLYEVDRGRGTLRRATDSAIRRRQTLPSSRLVQTLDLQVEAGQRYELAGARAGDGISAGNIDQWEPVVWRQKAARCRGSVLAIDPLTQQP